MTVPIAQVVQQAAAWADLDGVELVAQGRHDGRDCILVHVTRREIGEGLPEMFEGYPVIVRLAGIIVAQRPRPSTK